MSLDANVSVAYRFVIIVLIYASWPYTFLVDYIFSILSSNIISTHPHRSLTYILFAHTSAITNLNALSYKDHNALHIFKTET